MGGGGKANNQPTIETLVATSIGESGVRSEFLIKFYQEHIEKGISRANDESRPLYWPNGFRKGDMLVT